MVLLHRVTGLDTSAPSCTISDLSKTAVFNKELVECPAQAIKVTPPSLSVDLSFCMEDERFVLPDRSDKVICTGYLVHRNSAELSPTSERVEEHTLRALDVTIAEDLDISKWNQAARMVSHLKWNKPPVERNASLKP